MKFKYEFEMKCHDCYNCPFLRCEAFGNRYFCKGQDIKRKAKTTEEIIQECPLKIKEEK